MLEKYYSVYLHGLKNTTNILFYIFTAEFFQVNVYQKCLKLRLEIVLKFKTNQMLYMHTKNILQLLCTYNVLDNI